MSIHASSRWSVSLGGLILCLSVAYTPLASAIEFSIPFNDDEIEGTLNTTITVGAAMRMQGRSSRIIGKGDINPDVCAGQQICQGTFKNQGSSTVPNGLHPAATAAAAPRGPRKRRPSTVAMLATFGPGSNWASGSSSANSRSVSQRR